MYQKRAKLQKEMKTTEKNTDINRIYLHFIGFCFHLKHVAIFIGNSRQATPPLFPDRFFCFDMSD